MIFVFSYNVCTVRDNYLITTHFVSDMPSVHIPIGKKTSTRCLKDVLPTQARHLAKTSCRCPNDLLNANLKDIFVRHLEETFAKYTVDVLQKPS